MTSLNKTVNQAAEQAQAAIKNAGDSVKSSLETTRKVAHEKLGEVETHVVNHPTKALGIALLAGLALGCVLSMRRHH